MAQIKRAAKYRGLTFLFGKSQSITVRPRAISIFRRETNKYSKICLTPPPSNFATMQLTSDVVHVLLILTSHKFMTTILRFHEELISDQCSISILPGNDRKPLFSSHIFKGCGNET